MSDKYLTIAKIDQAMNIIENEGFELTHYMISQYEIDLVEKYCKENDIKSFPELVFHLLSSILKVENEEH